MTAHTPAAAGAVSDTLDAAVVGGPEPRPVPEDRPDDVRVVWEGDLDVASAPLLASAVRVLDKLGVRTVVLDISEVSFMDCAGLGALLDADTRLEGGLLLARPARAVLWLLALVGLTDRFATTEVSAPATCLPDTRVAIEQSKGLIMGTFGCTSDQASRILLSTALQQNVQVQVLAALLVTVASSELGHSDGGPGRAVHQLLGSTGVSG